MTVIRSSGCILSINKHVEVIHNNYICELCIKNRHCVLADLEVFESKAGLNKHLNGKYENSYMNHRKCPFCGTYHDDSSALYRHYRDEHRICEFCQAPGKNDKDYIFADYRAFMNHARGKHLICGCGGCDCVFKDVTSLDLHKAEYHNQKIGLRIANKEDDDEEEVKKVPVVSNKQYERMNNDRKNEHFPTLSNGERIYSPDEDEKVSKSKNSKKQPMHIPG